MVMDNICTLLGNFLRCTEIQNVVFCWVMHQQEIIDEILGRLNLADVRVVAVSLTCSEDALTVRLRKDIDAGIRQPVILERSAARLPLYEPLKTIKIDTTDKTVQDTARFIAGLR